MDNPITDMVRRTAEVGELDIIAQNIAEFISEHTHADFVEAAWNNKDRWFHVGVYTAHGATTIKAVYTGGKFQLTHRARGDLVEIANRVVDAMNEAGLLA